MMKMLKKKDDGKKPKATASKPAPKTAAKPKAAAKPLSNAGKYGLGAVARTVKGQGEMKQMLAPPKKAKVVYTPTPAQKKKSAEAGRKAAEASRASGKKLNAVDKFFERESQKFDNEIMEMPYYKGANITKENRYKGMSNKQLGGSKPRMKTNFERDLGL
jgi:hypothetical protein